MQEDNEFVNFLLLRQVETGNQQYSSAVFSVRMGGNGDTRMKIEFDKYQKLLEDARSRSDEFEERITLAQGRIEKLIGDCFPFLKTFLIGFREHGSVFDVQLMFINGFAIELRFSLFTIEEKYFYYSFGKQLIRHLSGFKMSLSLYLDDLFVAQKNLEIQFSDMESLWRCFVNTKSLNTLSRIAIGLGSCTDIEQENNRLEFFRILSGSQHLVSHCWENREILLFLERGSYNVFDPSQPFPNVPEILILFRHEQPHYRNVFFRFYLTHITLIKEILKEKLPEELVHLIWGNFIYYEK